MKKKTRILGLLLALSLVCALLVVPAAAQSTVTLPAAEYGITKNLIVDKDAAFPTETFTFVLIPGNARDGVDADNADPLITNGTNGPILAGVLPTDKTQITTTIGFTGASDNAGDANDIDNTIEANTKKYATDTAKFDLSGVSYDTPGIYRYTIYEQKGTNPAIEYDTNSYTLDVVVGYATADTGKLNGGVIDTTEGPNGIPDAEELGSMSILSYGYYKNTVNLTNNTDDPPVYTDDTPGESTTKITDIDDVAFPNKLTTDNLTISKKVTGSLGDKEKYFGFTVQVAGTVGYTYAIEIQDTATGAATTDTENPTTITSVAANTPATVSLKDGQQVVIKEIPFNLAYSVQEETVKEEGYTVAVATTEKDAVVTGDPAKVTVTADDGTNGTKVENVLVKGGNIEAFTNNKNTTPPTGVALQVLPFAVIVLVAAAGLWLMIASKRRRTSH